MGNTKKQSKTYSISVSKEFHKFVTGWTKEGFSQKQCMDELLEMFNRMGGALSVYHSMDHDVSSEELLDHTFFDHLNEGDYSWLWSEDVPTISNQPKKPTH